MPPQGVAETIFAHTEGNPYFMTEIVRLLAEREELTEEGIGGAQGLRLPDGVREAIGQRLNRLSDECNQALTTASVIGREFSLSQLGLLIDSFSADQLLDVVEEALGARVIEELSGPGERYQFTHGLVQETLASELSAARRVRLHARIAEALEELYGANAEAHSAELAHHFSQAEAVLGTEKLVRYTLLAGDRALATYAYEDALTHFERGLAARDITLSGSEAASDEEAAALLFGLARALSATVEGHQLVEAFATLSRAFEYYAEGGNVALAVAAAEFRIAPPSYRIPGVAELLARALTLVPAESHEAGRLLSRYGGILGASSDYEGAQQTLGRAISIARREGDVALEMQTLSYAAVVSYQQLRWQESVDNGLRAMELTAGNEDPASERQFRWRTAISLLNMGNLDAARPHALSMRDRAERRGTSRLNASQDFVPITYLSCLEGDWKAGREYSDRGLEISTLTPHLLLPRVLLEHETGESAQGEVYLERLFDVMRRAGPDRFFASTRVSMAITAIARITGVPDRLEIAETAAETVLSEHSVAPANTVHAKAGLALLAVVKGDRFAAEEHYAYIWEQRGTMIATVSSVDRLLSLLSQTMGNLDQAVTHFEEALAFCRKAGYRPELAWTCCDYADTLRELNNVGDREQAISLLDESLAISTELGMRPLLERVISRQDGL